MTNKILNISAFVILVLCTACSNGKRYKNPLIYHGSYPYATFHNGTYYYTMQTTDSGGIYIWRTDDISKIGSCSPKKVWAPTDPTTMSHIWSPEIHLINNKWYIYFEADDGNTDNHHIYVIENPSPDPTKGNFKVKGVIQTNKEWNWSIHPTVFTNKGKLYLAWSGWQKRRADDETQCIYIAAMKNPWTIGSERVRISRPEYEWERQWINPDGQRSAYPIYVNENPEAFHSKDGKKIIICYSASGCWTIYYTLGMLYADVNSDLLNPSSWKKNREPMLMANMKDSIYGPADISIIPSPDGKEDFFLYEAKHLEKKAYVKDIRLQKLNWDKNGLPVFGKVEPLSKSLPNPSGN